MARGVGHDSIKRPKSSPSKLGGHVLFMGFQNFLMSEFVKFQILYLCKFVFLEKKKTQVVADGFITGEDIHL